jgi:hypothetical protein
MEPMASKPFTYDCGAESGQRVRLKRDLTLRETDEIHPAGEIWCVDAGVEGRSRRIIALKKPDGRPHLWTGETFWDWFEVESREKA